MGALTQPTANKMTKQTFIDLGCWLSRSTEYSPAQLKRLQEETHYLALMTLANNYWLIGALVAQLKNKNAFQLLPEQLQDYLNEINGMYLERSVAIQQEVHYCCNLLQKANIDVVILKGAANLFNGVANPISSRFMKDIDILLPEKKLEQARQTLKSSGYFEHKDEFDIIPLNHHHAPPLIRENSQCYIELHRWPLKKTFAKILSTREVWQEREVLNIGDDVNVLQLSPSHQVILSIAHSELSNNDYQNKHIDLHQLFNLHQICLYYEKRINWQLVKEHFKRMNKYHLLQSSLYNMNQLFGLLVAEIDISNTITQSQFNKCLERYIKRQGQDSLFLPFQRVISGYRADIIFNLYGGTGFVSLWHGRLKHVIRHIKIVINKFGFHRIFPTIFKR